MPRATTPLAHRVAARVWKVANCALGKGGAIRERRGRRSRGHGEQARRARCRPAIAPKKPHLRPRRPAAARALEAGGAARTAQRLLDRSVPTTRSFTSAGAASRTERAEVRHRRVGDGESRGIARSAASRSRRVAPPAHAERHVLAAREHAHTDTRLDAASKRTHHEGGASPWGGGSRTGRADASAHARRPLPPHARRVRREDHVWQQVGAQAALAAHQTRSRRRSHRPPLDGPSARRPRRRRRSPAAAGGERARECAARPSSATSANERRGAIAMRVARRRGVGVS